MAKPKEIEKTGKEGLIDRIQRIEAEQVKQVKGKKKKEFKIPMNLRLGEKQKIKNNYVLVVLMRTNGKVLFKFLPVINDMIYLKDRQTYHLSSTDYVGYYKKYPVIVLPEWRLSPLNKGFSPINRTQQMEEDEENGNLALPQKVIINAMKLAQLKGKNKLAGGMVLWILIGAAVVFYLFYDSQKPA